jgi:hypothetical protein
MEAIQTRRPMSHRWNSKAFSTLTRHVFMMLFFGRAQSASEQRSAEAESASYITPHAQAILDY